MPRLVALGLPGGPRFVEALQRVWDRGDAAYPIDLRLPQTAQRRALAAIAPSALVDEAGQEIVLAGGRPVETGDALVVASSGTTGEPRGIVLTHTAVEASARATSARLGVGPGDRWLACLPLAHVAGLSVVTRALATDTPLTVLPAFDAAAVMAAAQDGSTLVSLVATALGRIDPTAFRMIVLGGARPPIDLAPNVVTTYGMTETGSGVVYDGVPLDQVEVRLDGSGQIHLRGPMLLRAYRDGTDPKDADGWLATGDLGAWDDDGRLVVHGRAGDLIITGGENVWPEAVEEILGRVAGVADVAVAGRDDPEWGQRVVAYVVPRDAQAPPTLEQLRDAVRAELAAFAAPRQLVLVGQVPRSALGKVRRAALAAEHTADV